MPIIWDPSLLNRMLLKKCSSNKLFAYSGCVMGLRRESPWWLNIGITYREKKHDHQSCSFSYPKSSVGSGLILSALSPTCPVTPGGDILQIHILIIGVVVFLHRVCEIYYSSSAVVTASCSCSLPQISARLNQGAGLFCRLRKNSSGVRLFNDEWGRSLLYSISQRSVISRTSFRVLK